MSTELEVIDVPELFPYQREDIEELKKHPRHILGSDPGTGKTTEVLHLCKELNLASVLVICPKPLIAEWEYQIEEWLGKEYLDYFTILNYEKLRRIDLVNIIMRDGFDLYCFDECHKLKNSKAKQTKGAFLITSDLKKRIVLMSGTPMQNGPQDLFSLFRIIDPTTYKSYSVFEEHFCEVTRLPRPPFPRVITGVKNREELRTLLRKHMIRREKAEVLPWLKKPLQHTIPVQLEGKQLSQYKQMEDELFVLLDSGEKITAPAVTAQIIRLRQICLEPNLLSLVDKKSSPSAKTRLVLELLDDLEGPIVLFTYFEKYIRVLVSELARAKISYMTFTGKENDAQKRAVILAFKEHKPPKLLLGTITSMSLGLNLTDSHHVIFTDWWYNPAVNDQAWQRLHRIGQTRVIEIHDVWARGTIEDAMHRTIKRKQKMINQVVANTAMVEELRTMRKER